MTATLPGKTTRTDVPTPVKKMVLPPIVLPVLAEEPVLRMLEEMLIPPEKLLAGRVRRMRPSLGWSSEPKKPTSRP